MGYSISLIILTENIDSNASSDLFKCYVEDCIPKIKKIYE